MIKTAKNTYMKRRLIKNNLLKTDQLKSTLIKKMALKIKNRGVLTPIFSYCFVLGWILLLGQMVGCGAKKKDPAAYSNQLITLMNQNEAEIAAMNTAMGATDYAKAETVRINWQQQLEAAIKTAHATGDYNGDNALQVAVISSLTAYQTIITGPYKSLIALRSKADTGTTTKQQALLLGINQGFTAAGNAVNRAIEAFQKRYAP